MNWSSEKAKSIMYCIATIALLVAILAVMPFFPSNEVSAEKPEPPRHLGHYMKTFNGIPCIWNHWDGRDDDIAICFNNGHSAVTAFRAMQGGYIETIDNRRS